MDAYSILKYLGILQSYDIPETPLVELTDE